MKNPTILLQSYFEEEVIVRLRDGKTFKGILYGLDEHLNIILAEVEKEYEKEEEMNVDIDITNPNDYFIKQEEERIESGYENFTYKIKNNEFIDNNIIFIRGENITMIGQE
ncbi:LSM domain protein [Spraguea lophii 42_110]|uniref:LSM domain protein n=1 Tax=Spraguea lophii (strain 42_110) TaxID=1358809 RepID=S7WAQ4_SPRLO|nr:LSM domain protein [Spraguea lophii 42_110]